MFSIRRVVYVPVDFSPTQLYANFFSAIYTGYIIVSSYNWIRDPPWTDINFTVKVAGLFQSSLEVRLLKEVYNLLLMEEIQLTTWDVWSPANIVISIWIPYQLVQDFWTIHSKTMLETNESSRIGNPL